MNTQLFDRYISYFRYAAMVNEKLDTIRATYDGKGAVLEDCRWCWVCEGGKEILPTDFQTRKTQWESELYGADNTLTVVLEDGPEVMPQAQVVITLCRDHVTCEATSTPGYTPVFTGVLRWGKDPERSTFAVSLDRPGKGLRGGCGPAISSWDDALLDREDGSVLQLDTKGKLRLGYSWEKATYTFRAEGSVGLQVKPKYFEDRFQLPYKPLGKKQYPTPPAGWMTWYAVKFDACEEAVLENTRLQKELLADYGADTVWVDWEWYHAGFQEDMKPQVSFFHPDEEKYPRGLKYVAERIEEMGFIPALWIAPSHEPVETAFIRENPEVVALDMVTWFGRYIFDITHPKFLEEYLPKAIQQVPAWGYKALKWDILPLTMDRIERTHEKLYAPECSTNEAYRRMVQNARDILGEDFYMLSCSGGNDRTVLTAGDIFDAARIGGDIFSWEEFQSSLVDRVLRLYPYHNTLFYCDPDNVVLREEFNDLHQARSRITIVSLLGLPITFGDDLRQLPQERLELLRRGLPTLDVHPMEMRELAREEDKLIINLVVSRPFESWNVVGVMNFAEEARQITVDLSKDLGLEEDTYLVHEYWTDTFYGEVCGSVTVTVPACGSAVLAVRKKTGKLQLVSTSRHLSQGAAELLDVVCEETKISGVSKVVKGDPYTIKAFDPKTGRLLEKTVLPEATGELAWTLEN